MLLAGGEYARMPKPKDLAAEDEFRAFASPSTEDHVTDGQQLQTLTSDSEKVAKSESDKSLLSLLLDKVDDEIYTRSINNIQTEPEECAVQKKQSIDPVPATEGSAPEPQICSELRYRVVCTAEERPSAQLFWDRFTSIREQKSAETTKVHLSNEIKTRREQIGLRDNHESTAPSDFLGELARRITEDNRWHNVKIDDLSREGTDFSTFQEDTSRVTTSKDEQQFDMEDIDDAIETTFHIPPPPQDPILIDDPDGRHSRELYPEEVPCTKAAEFFASFTESREGNQGLGTHSSRRNSAMATDLKPSDAARGPLPDADVIETTGPYSNFYEPETDDLYSDEEEERIVDHEETYSPEKIVLGNVEDNVLDVNRVDTNEQYLKFSQSEKDDLYDEEAEESKLDTEEAEEAVRGGAQKQDKAPADDSGLNTMFTDREHDSLYDEDVEESNIDTEEASLSKETFRRDMEKQDEEPVDDSGVNAKESTAATLNFVVPDEDDLYAEEEIESTMETEGVSSLDDTARGDVDPETKVPVGVSGLETVETVSRVVRYDGEERSVEQVKGISSSSQILSDKRFRFTEQDVCVDKDLIDIIPEDTARDSSKEEAESVEEPEDDSSPSLFEPPPRDYYYVPEPARARLDDEVLMFHMPRSPEPKRRILDKTIIRFK